MKNRRQAICFMMLLLLMTACTTDSYEKGEGKYSLMEAELVDLTIDSYQQATAFVTDDGAPFTLMPPVTASWIEKTDTVYRAILYFNRLTETTAEAVSLGAVPTLRPRQHWKFDEQHQDPIGLESAWLARSGKYLNMGLLIKTGVEDGNDGVQIIGLAQDTVLVNTDNTRTAYYRFLHDQGGVPEYYTSRRYVSILLPDSVPLDTIRLSIVTYQGTVERTFCQKR